MDIKIKYHVPELQPLEFIGDSFKSSWIDLRAAEEVFIEEGEFKLISLGISMELPEGYEAIIAPRSSTFKNWGLLMANGIGIVDPSYRGDNDVWMFAAYCAKGKTSIDINDKIVSMSKIKVNDRICQFRLFKRQEDITFVPVSSLGNENRGGFGSTGKN